MKNKRESGEVVVEASIIVTLVVLAVTVMLYIGMILYQQTLVSIIANQTAFNLAQIYSNNMKDPFTGYVEPEKVYQSVTYGNMKTDAYLTYLQDKASVFGLYRMESSQILGNDYATVDVEIVKKPNELLKSQLVVTIRDRFNLPLAFFFGTSSLMEFAASGRADCVDILEYINGVEAIGDPENSNVSFLPDSKNCTVTFVPDNDSPGNVFVETVLKGHSIMSSNRYTHCVMPADPQKGDLEFAGWYTEEGTSFTGTMQIEENITVYGRWLCVVTIDANGGTVNGKATNIKKVPYGTRTTLPKPERPGYEPIIVDGAYWFDDSGNPFHSNDTIIVDNCTYKVQWRCLHKLNGVSRICMAERKQFQCREVGGRRESYELYKCTGCDYESKIVIENKHYIHSDYLVETDELIVHGDEDDFTAQCDVNHTSSASVGVSGSYESGFGNATITQTYHITCRYCGMHLPKVWWDNITHKHLYKEMFWTSWSEDRITTRCRNKG